MTGIRRGMKGEGVMKIDMCFLFLFKHFSRTRRLKAGTELSERKTIKYFRIFLKQKGKLVYLCKIKVSTN